MELLGITFGLRMWGRSHQDIKGAVNWASLEMSAHAVSFTFPDLYHPFMYLKGPGFTGILIFSFQKTHLMSTSKNFPLTFVDRGGGIWVWPGTYITLKFLFSVCQRSMYSNAHQIIKTSLLCRKYPSEEILESSLTTVFSQMSHLIHQQIQHLTSLTTATKSQLSFTWLVSTDS